MAQYRPDAAVLLAAVAEVLDDALDHVPADQRHQVRVAAHLARLVERETVLGGATAADEARALADLLGIADDDLVALNDALAERLRHGDVDPEFERSAWGVLVEITRRDLDIAKPGHSDWMHG